MTRLGIVPPVKLPGIGQFRGGDVTKCPFKNIAVQIFLMTFVIIMVKMTFFPGMIPAVEACGPRCAGLEQTESDSFFCVFVLIQSVDFRLRIGRKKIVVSVVISVDINDRRGDIRQHFRIQLDNRLAIIGFKDQVVLVKSRKGLRCIQ